MSDSDATLRLGGIARIGDDRVRLLEAIARQGSITAAGQEIGLGFRATWDAVQALNNLFPKPLVSARAGGRAGGAAGLTPDGEATLRALRHMQAELSLAMRRLRTRLAGDPDIDAALVPWRHAMRTSARNALHGEVASITTGAVNSEVVLTIGGGIDLVAIISRRSVDDLTLTVGAEVFALIKTSFVILVAGDAAPRTSARNQLVGTVVRLEDGAVNSEVVLELADGKTLVATITRESLRSLGLAVGDRATALVKASHVILAVA